MNPAEVRREVMLRVEDITGRPVFDGNVPKDANPEYPYAVLADSIITEWREALGKPGSDHILTLRWWGLRRVGDTWMGDSQTLELAHQSRMALVRYPLPLTDGRVALLRMESTLVLPDPNQDLAQAMVSFRVISRLS